MQLPPPEHPFIPPFRPSSVFGKPSCLNRTTPSNFGVSLEHPMTKDIGDDDVVVTAAEEEQNP